MIQWDPNWTWSHLWWNLQCRWNQARRGREQSAQPWRRWNLWTAPPQRWRSHCSRHHAATNRWLTPSLDRVHCLCLTITHIYTQVYVGKLLNQLIYIFIMFKIWLTVQMCLMLLMNFRFCSVVRCSHLPAQRLSWPLLFRVVPAPCWTPAPVPALWEKSSRLFLCSNKVQAKKPKQVLPLLLPERLVQCPKGKDPLTKQ